VVGGIEVVEVCKQLVVRCFVLGVDDDGRHMSIVENITVNGLIPVFGATDDAEKPHSLSWV